MRWFSIGTADLNLPCKDKGSQPALINSCLMGKNCQGDTMQLSFLGGFHEAYRAGGSIAQRSGNKGGSDQDHIPSWCLDRA